MAVLRNSSPARRDKEEKKTLAPWLGIFLGLFLIPFLAGGIYCGVVFYRSLRDVVAYYNPTPAISPLPTVPGGTPVSPGETQVAFLTPQLSPTVKPSPTPTKEERLNILLMGLDQRPNEQGPFRSDTMVLVSIDRKSKTASMLSIPRDLWVPIPGYGENRINTAYFFGGPELAKQTVQYNLGVPVHYYAVVNFQGLEKIVDTLGGITIDVETAIYDDKYPDDNYGYQTVSIPAGRQRMNGDMALKYARVRHGASDFDRMGRQQKVLLAIRARAIELGPSLLPRLPTLWREFERLIDTDLPLTEATALAPVALQLDGNNVKRGSIDSTVTTPVTTSTGASVLWPDREKIGKLLEELLPHPGS